VPGAGTAVRPLPVDWYVDPAFHALEMQHVFGPGPGYVGQGSMVPEVGSYHVLDWKDQVWMLVRNAGGVELVSNTCRHRQAVMLEGRGEVRNIVCPIHRWSYDLGGRQRAAPHFPENPCLDLDRRSLRSWNGLLFEGARDIGAELAGFSGAAEFDYSDYLYQGTSVDRYPVNWKTFMEIYLELYHVEPAHSGLKGYVDCPAFTPGDWEFGATWSNQVMAIRSDLSAASEPYRHYTTLVTDLRGRPPQHAALWFCLYPNVMLEWYPEALAVSFLVPESASSTVNVVDLYYPRDILSEHPEIVEAHQAAYDESAGEDRFIVERIDQGRQALWKQGRDDVGPYQDPLEDGMAHFHQWVRAQVAPYL
jgi:phenylpropionate dioxygenase-like ring-hydroxylating dioxygenase large terminal subunit